MHCVLFDIDGTLTQSQSIDSATYQHSLKEVFGFTDVNPDWSSYRHTSDSGILHEIFEMRCGRAPTDLERSSFRTHFVDTIAAAAATAPFREIAGAGRTLDHLAQSPLFGVGLATGGWCESARCKMRSAGMRFDDFPAASADDALARVAIMQIALDRLIASRHDRQPDSVVYIGDGIWDARACRELGFPFIGIATGDSGVKLRAAGANDVFADYSDLDRFCAALTAARESVEMR